MPKRLQYISDKNVTIAVFAIAKGYPPIKTTNLYQPNTIGANTYAQNMTIAHLFCINTPIAEIKSNNSNANSGQ